MIFHPKVKCPNLIFEFYLVAFFFKPKLIQIMLIQTKQLVAIFKYKNK